MRKKKIEKYKNQPVLINETRFKECIFLEDSILLLSENIKLLARNIIKIGCYLDDVKNNNSFKKLGYESIYEFMEKNYHLSKNTTDNLVSFYKKFGKPESNRFADKYMSDNFSELLDLINVKNSVENYSPSQPLYENKVNRFMRNIDLDKKSIVYWFEYDLYMYLKSAFKKCNIKLFEPNGDINIAYKDYLLSVSLNDEDIHINNRSLFISYYVDFSCTIISEKVNEFIELVDSIGD